MARRRLAPVGLDFLGTAPVRFVFAYELAADPASVYRALAVELDSMPSWFRAVTAAEALDDGRGRRVALRGGVVFDETILAAEPDDRYAYRIDLTNAPAVRAVVEDWALLPAGTGTRVCWTFAVDGPAPLRVILRAGRSGLGRSFHQAMRSLDARLTSPAR